MKVADPLHIKFRPKTFKEFLGNKATVDSILNKIGKTHVYLLHGIRGCGKTTLARLIAKELEIAGMDLQEMNAADKTGVDDARQIISLASMMPMGGERRMYIIDEVHRFTPNAQDSLLKILEEPPAHVFFVLCTTLVDKIVKTVRSRAAEYQVHPLRKKYIDELLERVISQEDFDISTKTFQAIAEACQGIPREALVLLDMVEGLDEEEAIKMAQRGTVEDSAVRELIKLLMKRKPSWDEAREILKGLDEGEDVEGIRRGILGYLAAVMLNSKDPHRMACVMEELEENFYDSGRAGLALAVYRVIESFKS